MQTPAIVVSGVSSGVGKTTVAVGLMRALRDAGLRVQVSFCDLFLGCRMCKCPFVFSWSVGDVCVCVCVRNMGLPVQVSFCLFM